MANVSRARAARVAIAAATVLAVSGVSGCALTTPAISEVEEQTVSQTVSDNSLVTPGTLTVALDTNNAPEAMESNGKLTGYGVDVARAIARKMGLKVSFVNGTPTGSLDAKKADIYIGAEESATSGSIDLVDSYLSDATAVYAPKKDGSSKLSTDSLASATVAVQSSSASQDTLSRSGINAAQKTYSSINECFQALDSGEVDYVVCDANAGSYISRAYANIDFAGTLTEASKRYVACLSSASELSKAVGDALDTITADGTLDAIHTMWFGGAPVDLSSTLVSGVKAESSDDTDSSAETSDTASDEASSDDADGTDSSSDSSSSKESKSESKLDITDDDINKLKTD